MDKRSTSKARRQRTEALAAIERAMVRIRRSVTRRAIGRAMAQELSETLDPSMLLVLDAVEAHDSDAAGELTVGRLAAQLGVDQSRASRMVQSAIKAGYLQRVASQIDGRSMRIELTAAARSIAERARRFRTAYFARLVSDWPDRDCHELARLLTAFTAALSQADPDRPATARGRRERGAALSAAPARRAPRGAAETRRAATARPAPATSRRR
jgi:DNA-binding MarR family transcriptional regulator